MDDYELSLNVNPFCAVRRHLGHEQGSTRPLYPGLLFACPREQLTQRCGGLPTIKMGCFCKRSAVVQTGVNSGKSCALCYIGGQTLKWYLFNLFIAGQPTKSIHAQHPIQHPSYRKAAPGTRAATRKGLKEMENMPVKEISAGLMAGLLLWKPQCRQGILPSSEQFIMACGASGKLEGPWARDNWLLAQIRLHGVSAEEPC